MSLLDDRVAVVTGAARGIGMSIARRFTEEGASVVLGDIDEDALDDAVEVIDGAGGEAAGVGCDVADPDQVAGLVAAAVETFGSVDVLVNNAGITRDSTMKNMNLEDFEAVLRVHLAGSWLATKAATAHMREQGSGGSVINLSSIAGKVGNFGQTNYSAAKAGIVGLTKAAAKEVARHGIRVNAIQPGLIRTAMTEAMPDEIFEQKAREIPLGRAGEPEDVADAALFLASDLSRYITGTVLEVAGGRHM